MTREEYLNNENIEYCLSYYEVFEHLNNKQIVVAGATGLIGSHLIKLLTTYNRYYEGNIRIIALGRSRERLLAKFGALCNLDVFECNYVDPIDVACDYVINCASNTSSQSFIHTPANTILDNVGIMKYTLDIAKNNHARYIYTSSQEVYGHPLKEQEVFTEVELGFLATDSIRNSYPETKRLSELLAFSYAAQYDIDVYIARLAKCYALDSDVNDHRVIADFTRKASNGEDLVLKTKGEMLSTFGYVLDVVMGILYLASEDVETGIYNIGSPDSNYSIKDMAEMIANESGVKVVFELEDSSKTGFATVSHMLLSLVKANKAGFHGITPLYKGIKKILEYNRL